VVNSLVEALRINWGSASSSFRYSVCYAKLCCAHKRTVRFITRMCFSSTRHWFGFTSILYLHCHSAVITQLIEAGNSAFGKARPLAAVHRNSNQHPHGLAKSCPYGSHHHHRHPHYWSPSWLPRQVVPRVERTHAIHSCQCVTCDQAATVQYIACCLGNILFGFVSFPDTIKHTDLSTGHFLSGG